MLHSVNFPDIKELPTRVRMNANDMTHAIALETNREKTANSHTIYSHAGSDSTTISEVSNSIANMGKLSPCIAHDPAGQ